MRRMSTVVRVCMSDYEYIRQEIHAPKSLIIMPSTLRAYPLRVHPCPRTLLSGSFHLGEKLLKLPM